MKPIKLTVMQLRAIVDILNFYGEPVNWQSPSRGFQMQYDPELSPVAKDKGAKARGLLKKTIGNL